MIFSPQRNFCFIHVPKTGGTSIEYAYSRAVTFGDIILDGSSGTMNRSYLDFLNLGRHASAAQIVDLIGLVAYQSMFSCAVIRDPVERMISYFRWIHSFEHQGPVENGLKKILDFDDFVEVATEYLAPQYDFIFDPVSGERLVHFLIPYTMLQTGWIAICDFIKINEPLPHLNKSTAVGHVVSDEVGAQIHARYPRDFDLYRAIDNDFRRLQGNRNFVKPETQIGMQDVF